MLIKGNKILHGNLKWTRLGTTTNSTMWANKYLALFLMHWKNEIIMIILTCLSTFYPWYHQEEKEKWQAARKKHSQSDNMITKLKQMVKCVKAWYKGQP